MKRTDIINHLISTYNYQSYLEIGVGMHGENISRIIVDKDSIVGVDPNPDYKSATHCCTSDEFFSTNQKKFDIIFIDGLHTTDQVDKDISNSLTFLNDGGTIVLHDCNPEKEENGAPIHGPNVLHWNGDVWKSIIKVRYNNPTLSVSVVDTEFGCGIIQRGSQVLYRSVPLETCLTWEYFNIHRKELLNLISISEFENAYK
jgi:hypothetical protein